MMEHRRTWRWLLPAGLLLSLAAAGMVLFLIALDEPRPKPEPPLLDEPGPEPVTLTFGTSFRRRIDDGEEHVYVAEVPGRRNARVRLQQHDVDLSIIFLSEDGEDLWLDFPHGFRGEELLVLPVGTSTHFKVRAEQALAHPASYDLWFEPGREGDGDAHVRAQSAYASGLLKHLKSDSPDYAAALENYRTARDLWAELGEDRLRAYASFHLANCLYEESDLEGAVNELTSAIEILEQQNDLPGVAWALYGLGVWWNQSGQAQVGVDELRRALPLARQIGDRQLEGLVLNSLAYAIDDLGQKRRAIALYQQAGAIFRDLGNRESEAPTLNNLGTSLSDLGEYEAAIDMHRRSSLVYRELGSRFGEGLSLHNLASVYDRIGRKQEALEHFQQALVILEELEHKQGLITVHNNLGRLYSSLGVEDLALHHYRESLKRSREAGHKRLEAWALSNLGGLYRKQEKFDEAESLLLESLALRRQLEDRRGEAFTLNSLARLDFERGVRESARQRWEQALDLWREVGDRAGEADSLRNLCELHASETASASDTPDTGQEDCARALELSRQIADIEGEAKTLLVLAQLERLRGRIHQALERVDAAIERVELVRDRLLSQDTRSSFLASKRAFYELRVALLMDLEKLEPGKGWAARAFTAGEMARARSLREILHESGEIRRGVAPELLDRERRLRQQLSTAHERQVKLARDQDGAGMAEVAHEIERLIEQLRLVRGEIRQQSPAYAELTQPQPISLERVQALLGSEDLLLVFSLAEAQSYLWAVEADAVEIVKLLPRAELETRAKRLAGLLRQSHGIEARFAADRAGRALGQGLLLPIAGSLRGQRLLIVAEGALLYIPFAAMPHPSNSAEPLMMHHEIIMLPAASTLELWSQTSEVGRARSVAVVADPVFSVTDPRVEKVAPAPSPRAVPGEASTPVTRSLRDFGWRELPRLPYTRLESERISDIAGRETLQALDFAASRATVMQGDLSKYQILHFATHGLLNATHPELSGLVLSLVDPQGRSQDGFLRLHEIYDLQLDADLVVLSGCETALGKEVAGEGLVGLTRGFMYTGAQGVVASLWAVEDRATATWMSHFYEALLKRRLRPSMALREAQLALWRDPATESPYFWAAFQYQGSPDF